MNSSAARLGLAALAAMAPAVFGAMAIARTLATHQRTLPGMFLLGMMCGVVVLLVARSQSWQAVGVSAAVGAVGAALTYAFNAKWNTVQHAAAQFQAAHQEIEPAVAMMQAKTVFESATLWELMQANWDPIWLLAGLAAALGAGLTIKSHFIGKLLRVPSGSPVDITEPDRD